MYSTTGRWVGVLMSRTRVSNLENGKGRDLWSVEVDVDRIRLVVVVGGELFVVWKINMDLG